MALAGGGGRLREARQLHDICCSDAIPVAVLAPLWRCGPRALHRARGDAGLIRVWG